jgi:hypothetical protein
MIELKVNVPAKLFTLTKLTPEQHKHVGWYVHDELANLPEVRKKILELIKSDNPRGFDILVDCEGVGASYVSRRGVVDVPAAEVYANPCQWQ